MNAKRGQIAIFMLLILTVSIAYSFILYLNGSEAEDIRVETSKILENPSNQINLFVSLCLEKTAEEGIYTLGIGGGSYFNNSLSTESSIKIPFYLLDGKNIMPSLNHIESELSFFIEQNLESCIDKFGDIKEGYVFKTGDIHVESVIGVEDVLISLKYPIESTFNDNKILLEDFSSKLNFNFKDKYDSVAYFLEVQELEPESVALGQLSNLAYHKNFTFDLVRLGNDEILYVLSFNESPKDNFVYSFLIGYGGDLEENSV
ncbi:hypothetical protein ISS07_01110 [Candidatus Woesearchaeota archaeon]|nr:hypothetical protein [Candidatus Woesearchaeota archaeon]